jgi:hypothetical protein
MTAWVVLRGVNLPVLKWGLLVAQPPSLAGQPARAPPVSVSVSTGARRARKERSLVQEKGSGVGRAGGYCVLSMGLMSPYLRGTCYLVPAYVGR